MILTQEGKEIVAIYKQNGDEVDEVKDANGRLVYTNTREITGTLPLSFTSRGKPLSDYRISGNAVQYGTPTPDAPVDVVGCGVRTENVMPAGEKKTVEVNGMTFSSDGNGCYHISGTASQDTKVQFNLVSGFTTPVSVSKGGQGTLSFFNDKECTTVRLVFCNGSTEIDDWGLSPKNRVHTEYSLIGNKYVDSIGFTVNAEATANVTIMPEFTDDGILPSEFEPYGYKLPLTVNGTESPIYLGEAQTTRRVKKLVLTGDEWWRKSGAHQGSFYAQIVTGILSETYTAYCSHLTFTTLSRYAKGRFCFNGDATKNCNLWFNQFDSSTTVEDFKAYLAAQYAAGTPVTVWYILANPETSVVNEPLMKIGNYADTITMEQAGVTIPTIRGTNVLDMTTPVKPSEVYIKGKGIRAIT